MPVRPECQRLCAGTEDLRETEQVEDPHVDCAEKDAKVFGGGWSRVGQLQGKGIVGSSRVVTLSVSISLVYLFPLNQFTCIY